MKNLLLTLFALATVVLSFFAWRENEVISALTQTIKQITSERDGLSQREKDTEMSLAAAVKSRDDLEAAAKELRSRPAPNQTAAATRATTPASALAALDNPAMQRVLAASLKGTLDQRYAGLFRLLRLSPADLDKLKNLLAEKSMSGLDAMRVLQGQGASPNPREIEGVMNKVQGDMDNSIHALLGDQGFQQYQDYGQNIASYTLLDQIDRRLSYTNAPLQSSQSDALLHILEQTTQPPLTERGPASGAMAGFVQGFAGASPMLAALTQRPMTDATITAAQAVLDDSQLEALRQIRAEQQTQTNLLQSMRTNAGRPGVVPATPAPAQPPH